jgi:hypothetical protein
MRKTPGKATDDQEAHTENGHVQMLLTRELTSALIVMKGRTQLLRRRLRQGDDTAQLEADLEAIETEFARLTTIIERINRGGAGS